MQIVAEKDVLELAVVAATDLKASAEEKALRLEDERAVLLGIKKTQVGTKEYPCGPAPHHGTPEYLPLIIVPLSTQSRSVRHRHAPGLRSADPHSHRHGAARRGVSVCVGARARVCVWARALRAHRCASHRGVTRRGSAASPPGDRCRPCVADAPCVAR